MTTQEMLDRRYGRRRRSGSRLLVVIAVVLAVVAVGLYSWLTVASSLDAVDADTTGFDIVDQRTVVLDFQFTSPPGRSVACVLEAQDDEHGVVGFKVVEYEASQLHGRAYREVIPTTALAATGFVNDCWVT